MHKVVKTLGVLLLCTGRSCANPITKRFLTMKKTGSHHLISKYTPKSANQKQYVNYLKSSENKIIFAVGPAGTGKTLFACTHAIQEFKAGNIDKIVITRPTVPVEEDLGFLPGNINKKMDPWTRPIFDIFLENYSQRDIDAMVHAGTIEISPLAYMRGRTFKKCFIIADEMQNSTPNQMMMLTTRIGLGSRMVITGDLDQSDKFVDNGLKDFISKYNYYISNNNYEKNDINDIKILKLNSSDILRSVVVEKVIKMYNYKKDFTSNNNVLKNNTVNGNTSIDSNNSTNASTLLEKKNSIDPNNDAAMIPLKFLHPGY